MLQFFTPAETAEIMRCTEGWLRSGAYEGRFPHMLVGRGKMIFTSDHIDEIARVSSVPVRESSPTERKIGTRAQGKLDPGNVFGATDRSYALHRSKSDPFG